MRGLLIIAAAAMLGGCASTSLMNGIMSSWEGSNIDAVAAQWGYPHSQQEFNGRKLYIWHHNKSAPIPMVTNTTGQVSAIGNTAYVNAVSTTTGGGVFRGSCDRILEVDSSGTVVSWEWRGNNCPFLEAMEYRHWRNRNPTSAAPVPACRPPMKCD